MRNKCLFSCINMNRNKLLYIQCSSHYCVTLKEIKKKKNYLEIMIRKLASSTSSRVLGVCLVESESFKDTSKIVNKANGSKGLGLFQINNRDWCKFSSSGGKCNMKCEDLINEDIRDDVNCARKAIDELGFQAWDGWKRSCKGRETVTKMPSCPGLK